jgi:hypothetical protein
MFDPPIAMDDAETLARIQSAVESLRSAAGDVAGPSGSSVSVPGFAEKLPAWVSRFGLLWDHSRAWLFCEPHTGAENDATGQVLLRFPSGRYLVDAFDLGSGCCVSRESASGGPLVAGLPFSGSPVILAIRKMPG